MVMTSARCRFSWILVCVFLVVVSGNSGGGNGKIRVLSTEVKDETHSATAASSQSDGAIDDHAGGSESDSGHDAGSDAGSDAGHDTGHDAGTDAGHGTGHGGGHSLHPSDKTRGGIFIAFCLFAGVCIKVTLKWFGLPFTVVLLIFGIGAGMWEKYREQGPAEEVLGESMRKWAAIDPHVFLFIFLPALLYEASGSVDIHIFGRAGMQMLLLAGPGVVISTVLTATVVQELFDYGWTWETALCFGAMMSATDPVAVVALLGELGASKRLSLLIEGESLLNDGTAMVVFMVFEKAMGKGAPPLTTGMCMESFVQLAGGGVVLGWVVGQVTVVMLANIINDPACEITLTLTAAYGGFFLAEGSAIGASGVLTVVIIGLTMSYSGTTALSPGVHHFMHEFWHMMGFLANTIIFILSGLIIVEKYHDESIRNYDWGLCVALWLALNLVRGFVVMLMSPILVRLGYGLSFSQAAVVVWGGLRGAVGLALAMIVEHDPAVDERVGQLFLFHMAGIVILTLVVNGSTTGMLVRYLKLHKSSTAAKKTFENAACSMDAKISESVAALKHNRFYSDADWALVWNTMPVFTEEVFEKRKARVAGFNPKKSTVAKAISAINAAYHDEDEERELSKAEVMAIASQAKQILEAGGKSKFRTSNRAKNVPEEEYAASADTRKVMSASDVLQYAHSVVNSRDKLKAFQFQQHARHSYFNLVKSNYWHQFETGFTSSNAHKALEDAANRAEDAAMLHDVMRQQLDEWVWADDFTAAPWMWTLLGNVPIVNYLANFYIEKNLELAYDIANSFVLAHKQSTMQFIHSLEPPSAQDHGHGHGHGDNDADNDDSMNPEQFIRSKLEHSTMEPDSKNVVFEILMDASYSMGRAQAFLDDLKMQHPHMAVSIATKSVCYALLADLQQHAEHLAHHGELEEKEAGIVEKALLKARKKLHFQNCKTGDGEGSALSQEKMGLEILKKVPFFTLLPRHLQEEVSSIAESRVYNRGSVLFHEGDTVSGIFVVIRGTVKVKASHDHQGTTAGAGMQNGQEEGDDEEDGEFEVLGSGEVFGMLEVVYESSSRLVSAHCESSAEILHIPASQIQHVLQQAVGHEGSANEAAWRDAACTQMMICRHSLPLFAHLNPQATRLLLANTHLYKHGGGSDSYPLPGRAILMRGMVKDHPKSRVLQRAVSMWEPTDYPKSSRVSFTHDAVLLFLTSTSTATSNSDDTRSASASTNSQHPKYDDSDSLRSDDTRAVPRNRRTSMVDASRNSNAQAAAAVSNALAGHHSGASQTANERLNLGSYRGPHNTTPPPAPPPSQFQRISAPQGATGPAPISITNVTRSNGDRRAAASAVTPAGSAKLRSLVKERYQSHHDQPNKPTLDSMLSGGRSQPGPTTHIADLVVGQQGDREAHTASHEAPIRSFDLIRSMTNTFTGSSDGDYGGGGGGGGRGGDYGGGSMNV
jgi:NhaP-type Na+/H+ or K+/H+ antiporter